MEWGGGGNCTIGLNIFKGKSWSHTSSGDQTFYKYLLATNLWVWLYIVLALFWSGSRVTAGRENMLLAPLQRGASNIK